MNFSNGGDDPGLKLCPGFQFPNQIFTSVFCSPIRFSLPREARDAAHVADAPLPARSTQRRDARRFRRGE